MWLNIYESGGASTSVCGLDWCFESLTVVTMITWGLLTVASSVWNQPLKHMVFYGFLTIST